MPFKDNCGYVTQLKQQISKRCYYLAAHRRVFNVLTSNSAFLSDNVLFLWISHVRSTFLRDLVWTAICLFTWTTVTWSVCAVKPKPVSINGSRCQFLPSSWWRCVLLCCSVIAALGLAENSSVVLVASMLVSPLMVTLSYSRSYWAVFLWM